jgi:hypothetical protein
MLMTLLGRTFIASLCKDLLEDDQQKECNKNLINNFLNIYFYQIYFIIL